MAKFFGPVGYGVESEGAAGVWSGVTERSYYGDVIKNSSRMDDGKAQANEIVLNNQISIVADPYAYQNFFAIRYVKWQGVYWTVTNVTVQRPRLLLTIGGVYNGETA